MKKIPEPAANKVKHKEDIKDLFDDLLSNDESRRRYALRMLPKNASAREVLSFIRGLRPYEWEGKISAIKLLGKLGDEVSIESFKALILDFNPRVRQAARRTLEKLGVKNPFFEDDLVELVGYLDHPSWWVKTSAIKSLVALKDKRALEPISQLLLDEDETVREAATEALESIKKSTRKL